MSAEVHDRGLQLTHRAKQVEWLGRPSGHELESIAVAGALQLVENRLSLLIERQPPRSGRVGRQEQDHVLLRRGPRLRWLLHQ
jgi:hypothetical protein